LWESELYRLKGELLLQNAEVAPDRLRVRGVR